MPYASRLSLFFLILAVPLIIFTGLPRCSILTNSVVRASQDWQKLLRRGLQSVPMGFKMEHHFRKAQQYKIKYSPHTLTEYVSDRTGMRVVVTDQKGPKVLGTFAVATEIFDDSGSPHTLEHLCFLGSKTYPYKGLLDKLATRVYSSTNAWTSTDHTAYTLETAGYAAFAQVLPIYLEHILLPTLTDSGCYTEVFHIDGSGHDAGVVYSEMQGVQNTQAELMELRGKRIMYKKGIGFRYETGGMLEQLRVLTADRIRQFHRDMYQPRNLCLLITGEIDHEHLLSTLEAFEKEIIPHLPDETRKRFKRPWLASPKPEPLAQSIVEEVEFPEEDESTGEVSIKYFGPGATDVVGSMALAVLLSYLAGSSASVLDNVLVEKEQLATAVYHYTTPRPNSVVEFTLSGVDASKLAEVEARFVGLLAETEKNGLDMPFLTDCLDQERRRQLYTAENTDSPFSSAVLYTFLFSRDRDLKWISHLSELDELSVWTEDRWIQFLKDWFVNAHRVTILGKPSAVLAERLKEEEERRVEAQIKNLGKDGLQKMKEKLEDAKAQNERPIPGGMLESYKIPPIDTIPFVSTIPARSGIAKDLGRCENAIQKVIDRENSELPLFIQFEHIPSNFAHIYLLISTQTVPVHLRPLLTVYLDNFFVTPFMKDGKRVEFEDVVKHLERETVSYRISSAKDMNTAEVLRISFHVEKGKYGIAIQSIKDLMWSSIFDLERTATTTIRLLTDVHEEKRSGDSMVYAISSMIGEAPESLPRARDTLVKALYLKKVKRLLATDPDKILNQLEEIRAALCQASNFRVLVIADIEKLNKPVGTWEILTEGLELQKPLVPIENRLSKLSPASKEPGNLSYIVPLPTIDSSFAVASAKAPESQEDPRLPALLVATTYLDAVEGPLWDAVRGAGLAYGTNFRWRLGNIEFSVYRSPDAFKAFAAARKVIEDFVSGATEFDSLSLEGAVSSIVLGIANSGATLAGAAMENFTVEVISSLPRDWNHIFLEKVRNVTADEMKDALKTIILPVFRPESTNLFVTCSPVMEEGLVKSFTGMGFRPEVKPLSFFQDDYGLEAGEGDDLSLSDEDDVDDGLDGVEEDGTGESQE